MTFLCRIALAGWLILALAGYAGPSAQLALPLNSSGSN